MRVLTCLIRRPGGPRTGGAMDAARWLAREVIRCGVEVEFAEVSEADGEERREDLPDYKLRLGYHVVPGWLRRLVPFLRRREFNVLMFSTIKALVRRSEYEVVHIQNLHPIWAAWQIAFHCKRRRKPYVLACHGIHEAAGRFQDVTSGAMAAGGYFAITLPLRYLVRNSALCFASSPADVPVIESLGGRPDQVHLVPNGVEPTFLVPQPEEDLRRVRQTYGLPTDRPLLLFVGHVRPKKGVDTLIEALTRVPGEWHAAIVGPHTFPRLAAELQETVRRHGLEKAVTFTEAVSFTELKSLYQLADVCLFPSRVETFPLTVLEAMSKGRPVIATRVGGIAYQLEDDAGILVEPDDSDGLAAAIRALLEDPERRARMGAAGRARLEREFTWPRAAELAVDGYEKAVAKTRG